MQFVRIVLDTVEEALRLLDPDTPAHFITADDDDVLKGVVSAIRHGLGDACRARPGDPLSDSTIAALGAVFDAIPATWSRRDRMLAGYAIVHYMAILD